MLWLIKISAYVTYKWSLREQNHPALRSRGLAEENSDKMASVDEVKNITGYTIGGVSPIGHLNKLEIFIDNSLERFNELFAAAGHPNCVFKINFSNLQKITNGSIKEITE